MLSGYGWIFPLGNGEVNVGVGTLATAKRPAEIAIKPLMAHYAAQRRADFGLGDELRMPTSALLPMGGAVSGVAGANWALIGDAAACVNPLNGEGIDYGLESGRLLVETMAEHDDLSRAWPALLREHYGEAFSIARRLAGLVTVPRVLPALGPGGHALGLADDPRPALDGQPGHRRGPRPRRPRVALGRPPVDRRRRPPAVRLTGSEPPTWSAGTARPVSPRARSSAPSTSGCATPASSTCRAPGPSCWPATTCRTRTSSGSGWPPTSATAGRGS